MSTETPIESEIHADREARSAMKWSGVIYVAASVADAEDAVEQAVIALAERKTRNYWGPEVPEEHLVRLAKQRVERLRERLTEARENLSQAYADYLDVTGLGDTSNSMHDVEQVLSAYRTALSRQAEIVALDNARSIGL